MSFKNKTVLITGASSGIGAATAIAFAKEGVNVAIIGRNQEKLAITVSQCAENGQVPLVMVADVTKDEDLIRAVDTTVKQFGGINVLVNNAGLMRFASILDDNIMEAYDQTFDTNLRAIFRLTNLAAPHLIKSSGNIVNISSIAALKMPDHPSHITYYVSKAAVDHFTRCIAAELASKGVRVNSVNPGPVRTDFADNIGLSREEAVGFWERSGKLTALGRICEPEEIADMTVFLASDKARGITGASFVVDNGKLVKIKTP
ncbi:3-oxoacyl-[acyl-carrier-protein] reductase FabG [Plutella xylostella]|uniref:3-oxoacyl-[acyl-carrier-protein] reductase FabG n=1 Tax=Plutella xylostella TaxID=51655 RepID=UPI002033151F|nr:3-oxoacyl-[acyl-carrier-protein] reductase FabG [Plutella xylostella]